MSALAERALATLSTDIESLRVGDDEDATINSSQVVRPSPPPVPPWKEREANAAADLNVTKLRIDQRETLGVRAFKAGLTPLTLGLLVSTGWVLAAPYLANPQHRWGATLLIAISVIVMMH